MITLDNLPVEVLHRIIDHLDLETISFSLRYVSQRFYSLTDSYHRYDLDFQSMSKAAMQSICNRITFDNVISLRLSDEDRTRGQIAFFLSSFRLEQFPRLQSLTLLQIEPIDLQQCLPFISQSKLTSLHITTRFERSTKVTIDVSSLVCHSTIRHLQLNLAPDEWNRCRWPICSLLTSLGISHRLTVEQFQSILQQSSQLQRFVLAEIPRGTVEKEQSIVSLSLKSLTFENSRINIDQLERCLSLTPALNHLKIIGEGTLFDSSFNGSRWETLIQQNLSQLKTLQFFFTILIYGHYHSRQIDVLITPFRTSFWLKTLRSSIRCDYIVHSRKILLYTLPLCLDHFVYHSASKKISLTNSMNVSNQNDMQHVTQLELQLTKEICHPSNFSSSHVLFDNVTNLILGNDGQWPTNSILLLSKLLNLSKIVKLSLSVNFLTEHLSNFVANLQDFFNQTSNLRSLFLFDYWSPDNCLSRMKIICSILSPTIKHLQIRVKNLDDILFILQELPQLTSVTFEYSSMLIIQREQFLQSLAHLDRFTSLWYSENTLHVWLGTNKSLS